MWSRWRCLGVDELISRASIAKTRDLGPREAPYSDEGPGSALSLAGVSSFYRYAAARSL
ncbi:hypothetical protein OCEANICA350_10899 [Oceanicaulis sp. 350]|nr:hypothetical protein OCEANICA350_10899 [Oceanicaulis sp. 350]